MAPDVIQAASAAVLDGGVPRGHCPPMTEQDFEAAVLTVRLGAIADNYRMFRRLAGTAATAAVVKADAYGLGAATVAPFLGRAGCDTFFVARLQEGIALRPKLGNARIFVLDGAPPDSVPALLSHRLIPMLNGLGDIASWSAAARAAGHTLDAGIHLDTGLNRLGLPAEELSILAAEWRKRLAGLNPVLAMSHLACADEPDHPMNRAQLTRFRDGLAMLPPMPASLAASAGILLGTDYHFDLVRPGVGLYGANPQSGKKNPCRTVVELNGRILQLRRIDKGECVGYGATFRAQRPSMIATVALGYADGMMRTLSNKGMAAFAGSRVHLAGRVSMDSVALDVSAIPQNQIAVGDLVEFLGDTIRLDDVAELAGTNAYEILTGLGGRVPRHYVDVESVSDGVRAS